MNNDEPAGPAQAANRWRGASQRTAFSAADVLRATVAERGLVVPPDLVTPIGAGATTLWKLNAAQTLVVANTSRGASIDDAFDSGRIAATAALSAVHATAALPLFARLTCACPDGATESAKQALIAGAAVALSGAGAVLADAQMVDAPTLRFDVLVAGVARPDRLRGVDGAQAGDVLILAGSLGLGIYVEANVRGRLADADRLVLIDTATRANRVGIALGTIRNVHAVAEVGAEGLIAALRAIGRDGADVFEVAVDCACVPALPLALALAKAGCVAPASSANWNRDGAHVALADVVMPEMRSLLTDPHPTGALLIACKPESVERVLRLCTADGGQAVAIGSLRPVDDTGERVRSGARLTIDFKR